MRKRLFILFFLIFSITTANSNKISGYFITNTNDTVRVMLNIPIKYFSQEPNFVRIQNKVKYFDSKDMKNTIKPDMAIEIVFEFNGKKYRLLSRYDNLGLNNGFDLSNKIFLHLIKDGEELKLFKYYYSGSAGTPMMSAGGGAPMMAGGSSGGSNFILQKKGDVLYKISVSLFNSFISQVSGYFSNCPEVLRKIRDKSYRKDDIELIVEDYNRNCK